MELRSSRSAPMKLLETEENRTRSALVECISQAENRNELASSELKNLLSVLKTKSKQYEKANKALHQAHKAAGSTEAAKEIRHLRLNLIYLFLVKCYYSAIEVQRLLQNCLHCYTWKTVPRNYCEHSHMLNNVNKTSYVN